MKKYFPFQRLVTAFVIVMVLCIFGPGLGLAQKPHPEVNVQAMTTPVGTMGYIASFEMGKVALTKHPWLRITTQETPASYYMAKKLATDKGLWTSTVMASMSPPNIKKLLKEDPAKYKAASDYMVLFNYAIGGPVFFQTFDEDIKSPEDMIGKRIAMGKKTQLMWAGSAEALLRGWGIHDKVRIDYLGTAGASSALMDGRVKVSVAATFVGAPGQPPIVGRPTSDALAKGKKLYFLGGTEKEAQKAYEIDKGLTGDPLSVSVEFLPGKALYPSGADAIWGVAHLISWDVHKSFPEEIAYELTKLVLENYKALHPAHALLKLIRPEVLPMGHKVEEIHPGALRAYQEYVDADPGSKVAKLYREWGIVR